MSTYALFFILAILGLVFVAIVRQNPVRPTQFAALVYDTALVSAFVLVAAVWALWVVSLS